jgi:hypothetical protein
MTPTQYVIPSIAKKELSLIVPRTALLVKIEPVTPCIKHYLIACLLPQRHGGKIARNIPLAPSTCLLYQIRVIAYTLTIAPGSASVSLACGQERCSND